MTIFMMTCAISMNAQSSGLIEAPTHSDLRHQIGLDLTLPDFSVKKPDADKIGSRLAGLLCYLQENYKQAIYNRRLVLIISEQNDNLSTTFFEVRKLKLARVSKTGNVITIRYTATLNIKLGETNKTDLVFTFTDGLSASKKTNELFAYMGRYVSLREQLDKQ